jgi:NADH-ubiquinone oxidoreductase chain 6
MEIFLPIGVLKIILPLLAIIAGVFVITTKNAIISVFNLIVLYILVAFYLIYIGITYLGISYIVVYIGAIAILFLFVIMMIDIEVVEKRSNNYLPLLFLLLSGFFFTLKNILYNIGIVKMKSLSINIIKKPIIHDNLFNRYADMFNSEFNSLNEEKDYEDIKFEEKTPDYIGINKLDNMIEDKENDIQSAIDYLKKRINESEIETENETEYEEETFLEKEWEWELVKKNRFKSQLVEDEKLIIEDGYLWDLDIKFNKLFAYNYEEELQNYNYLLVVPNWDSAANRVTQITAIGDVLYTVYHSYIYIISVLLLLGMIGAIILTADSPQPVRIIKKLASISNSQRQAQNYIPLTQSNKKSGFLYNSGLTVLGLIGLIIFVIIIFYFLVILLYLAWQIKFIWLKWNNKIKTDYWIVKRMKLEGSSYDLWPIRRGLDLKEITKEYWKIKREMGKNNIEIIEHQYNPNDIRESMIPWESGQSKIKIITPQVNEKLEVEKTKEKKVNMNRKSLILPFYGVSNFNTLHTEEIIGNLFYFIVATLIIAALLLFINSYFSLSVKYLDKGGGFECGFTSFVQTRERFNVIFYRVSLLFLVFDLEIILIFPYTAIYQKYQNISKNNVLAFLYILIVGFIYELKEGALNIVKKAHTTEINDLE